MNHNTHNDQASMGAWALLPAGAAVALAVGGGLYGAGQMPVSGFLVWALLTLAAAGAGCFALWRQGADARSRTQRALDAAAAALEQANAAAAGPDISEAEFEAMKGQIDALSRSQAVIEFNMDGTILTANDNFLSVLGYSLDEIKGQHHRIFVDPQERESSAYADFWRKLGRGEFDAGQYKRLAKDGHEVWIQATYNPVFDVAGKPVKVVKYATDVSAEVQAKQGQEAEARRSARANVRIKSALDNVTTNVMIADNERNIIYMNDSVKTMMKEAEADIQKELPGFKVDGLEGANIDSFHKNPEHQIKMLKELTQTYRTQITLGGRTFGLIASPVIDEQGVRLGTVVEWKDRTAELKLENEIKAREEAERRIAAENLQIRNALDNVTVNVMIADNERNITYMNKAVVEMLRDNEADLRKELPSFSVEGLMGRKIDDFHKNPAHQARLLEALRSTYSTQIKVGELHFGLVANPIITPDGEHRGSVVEWIDRTAEVAVENEIGQIVDASARGQFDNRISLDGKKGFFENLATGINTLLDTCEVGFTDVIRVLSALAKGDLTQKIDADYQGTFAELKDNLNETIDSLTDMVVNIKQATDDINFAASDVSAGSEDLSSRTEQQAASLEETASSMEELTSTVKQNADNAKQANQLAIGASDVATKGGEVVGQVVTRMSEITDSSKKIEDIISVIEGIAFQTNILALNAAVEAARAGEQGRGFAVVASEVRSLAQRSSGAAKEIKSLISDSVERIEDGSKLVEQAGKTMEEIVNSVKRVTDIMAEISAASQEQSSGIEQINQTVAQMDDATQQNAALVEESSASARSLMEQAESLAGSVARFRLKDAMDNAAEPIVVAPKAKAASKPAARPAPRAAEAARPASRPQPKAASAPPRVSKPAAKSGEDHEHWTEF